MPYLKIEDKEHLLEHMYPTTAGELNYLLTTMVLRYWMKSARNYEALNAAIGALESSKQEFYRRIVVPYENKKIHSNGDVYEGEEQ